MTRPAAARAAIPAPRPPSDTPARRRHWTRDMAAQQRAATARACAMLVRVTAYRDLVELQDRLEEARAALEHEQAKATVAARLLHEAEAAQGLAEHERDVARRERDLAQERVGLARDHFRHVQAVLLADEDRADEATGAIDMRSGQAS